MIQDMAKSHTQKTVATIKKFGIKRGRKRKVGDLGTPKFMEFDNLVDFVVPSELIPRIMNELSELPNGESFHKPTLEEDKEIGFMLTGYKIFCMDSSETDSDNELAVVKSKIKSRRWGKNISEECVGNQAKIARELKKMISTEGNLRNMSDFRNQFGVSKMCAEILIPLVEENSSSTGRPGVRVEKQVLICLWMLRNQESLRAVSERFNNTKSTIRSVFLRVCDILIMHTSSFIVWPNNKEMKDIAHFFEEKSKLPAIVGCLGTVHVAVLSSNSGKTSDVYTNSEGMSSIILQGVCNHRHQFIDVFCETPGSVRPETALQNSDFYKTKLQQLHEDVYVLGGLSYPLLPNLITPFPDNGQLTEAEKGFNDVHSSVLATIAQSFAMLKSRFECLKSVNVWKTELVPKIILTCCILHNIAVSEEESVVPDVIDADTVVAEKSLAEPSEEGLLRRSQLVEFLELVL